MYPLPNLSHQFFSRSTFVVQFDPDNFEIHYDQPNYKYECNLIPCFEWSIHR
jgi:hypothetical protein